MRESPSVTRIIGNDPAVILALSVAAIPLICGAFVWSSYAFGRAVPVRAEIIPPTALQIAVASLLVGAPFSLGAAWWIAVTRRTFRSGVESEAIVEDVVAVRHGTSLHFRFRSGGSWLKGKALSTGSGRSRRIVRGSAITVVFDPANPRRCFVRELYVDASS